MRICFKLAVLLWVILAVGCSVPPALIPDSADSAPLRRLNPKDIKDAVPRLEAKSRYGNPANYKVRGKRYYVLSKSSGYREKGVASWYGTKFHGRRTSSGEPYDMYAMTAAHKSLPLPTYVQVNNLRNGRSIVVRVNDRGPFHNNRIIDLSYAAATKLGILGKGTGLVEVVALDPHKAPTTIQAVRPENPAPLPPSKSTPDMFIQVGAFSNRTNANRLRQQLQHKLERPVRVYQSQSRGQDIFRVQVGPLTDIGQSDAVTRKLARLGVDDLHIIVE